MAKKQNFGGTVKTRKCLDCGGTMHGTRTYYRYTECGLDSVTLENIVVYRCSCGAIVPEIPAIGELHRELVISIIEKPSLLAGQEIRFLRKMAGLSSKDLAHAVGASASTVSRWENGSRNISKKSDAALRLICLAGMLQEILADRNLLPRVAEATKRLSEVNIRDILSKVTNCASDALPMTIDPNQLSDWGPRKAETDTTAIM